MSRLRKGLEARGWGLAVNMEKGQLAPSPYVAQQRRARGEDARSRGVGCAGERSQMAHLSSGPGRWFAVQMKFDVRQRERRLPVRLAAVPQVAEQVRHRRRLQHLGRTERKAADRAQLLLELARAARV